MRLRAALAGAVVALVLAGPAAAHRGEVLDPPDFEPPAPGSYRLYPIQPAPEGAVLDPAGRSRPLSAYTRGRITILGLVYTRCADPDGCPRSTWAFQEVRALLRADAALERRVRLVSLSFDPAHDTPEHLGAWGSGARGNAPGADWEFLTTRSTQALSPILDGFGQDLRVATDSLARPGTEEFTHTLKVFLIDPRGMVREIYSTAFLMPAMMVNDIRTLAMEEAAPRTRH
jgi:protein SCO1